VRVRPLARQKLQSPRCDVRNSVAKMRSFLTLPRADEFGGPTDSRSGSTLMCPAAFTGSLSRPCLPCGLRLLFNSPPQPRAECNQGMPVTQSERNFAGLLVHGGVGIGFVWYLDDLDATHNANPEKMPGPGGGSRLNWIRRTRRGLLPLLAAQRAQRGTALFPQHREVYQPHTRMQHAAGFMVIEAVPHHASTALSPLTGCRGPWLLVRLGKGPRAASDTVLALLQTRLWPPVRCLGVRHGKSGNSDFQNNRE
jgi:hypothetical protein